MDKEKILQNIPQKPWIYIFKDSRDNILYVWKAKNLKNRVSQYFNPNSVWKQDMLNKAKVVDFLQVNTESEALYLEDNMIKTHQPPYNNLLKGSNSYSYIKITNEDFPQIFITKRKIKDWATYIWPKHNTIQLKKFLQYIRQVLQYRWCKKTEFQKHKLCSDYYFGLCKWWCVLKESSLSERIEESSTTREQWLQEYTQIINQIKKFFKWNTKDFSNQIKTLIQQASEKENFERAAKLRDIYIQIEQFSEQQNVVISKDFSGYSVLSKIVWKYRVFVIVNFFEWKIVDVITNKQLNEDVENSSFKIMLEKDFWEFTQQELDKDTLFLIQKNKLGKKEQTEIIKLLENFFESYIISQSFQEENLLNDLLKTIQSKYKLQNFPYQIECLDISHLSWWWTAGGLSCFVWWIPNKKLYRKYKIQSEISKSDDYWALKEVIKRRFEWKNSWYPDLFVIDWGKGQLWVLKEFFGQIWFEEMFEKVDFISLWKWVARKRSAKSQWEKEQIFYFDSNRNIKSIQLDYDTADQILVKIRDEAHRFSNFYRKQQMGKEWK